MNILHIVNSLCTGGLESMVVDMAILANSTPNNMEFLILPINNPPSFLQKKAKTNNVKIVEISNSNLFMKVKKIIAKIKENKINIIHTHNSGPLTHGILASKFSNIPIIHTKHGNYILNKTKINYWTSRFAYHSCNKIAAVSEATKKSIMRGFNISENRIVVVPNGVNTEIFNLKNMAPRPKNKILSIGCIGRLSPEKGHMLLIEAFARVNKIMAKTKLVIVGSGLFERKLRAKVKSLNIANSVEFLGERFDIPELMSSFDIYAQTSLTEGMSITLLEAMAMKLPIIATDVGGNKEIIENNKTGILTSLAIDDITKNILNLINSPEFSVKLAIQARKIVELNFSTHAMLNNYSQLYNQLFNNNSLL